jgi:hypothetical protein
MLANSSTSPTAPIGTILDLDKLIFSPETASKHSSKHLKSHNGLTLGLQKIKVSSVNKKWVIIIASDLKHPSPTQRVKEKKDPLVIDLVNY